MSFEKSEAFRMLFLDDFEFLALMLSKGWLEKSDIRFFGSLPCLYLFVFFLSRLELLRLFVSGRKWPALCFDEVNQHCRRVIHSLLILIRPSVCPKLGLGAITRDQSSGAAKLAFGALRAFRYDSLSLSLNGDIGGELVTEIAFQGVNREPVKPIGGPAPISLVGIPFKFNVTVHAPFMALARTAAGFSDARGLLDQALPDVSVTATPLETPKETPPKAP